MFRYKILEIHENCTYVTDRPPGYKKYITEILFGYKKYVTDTMGSGASARHTTRAMLAYVS